jgi:hypothetical protein
VTIGQIIDGLEQRTTRRWANPSWWNLFVVLPWALGAILFIYEWKVDREISTREQTTQGVITTHEPANHNRYGYAFSVNEKPFNGWESPKKQELEIGKRVVVYYDPQNPKKNALTDFRELGMDSIGPVPMLLFGIGAVAWFIRAQRRKSRTSNATS